LAEESTVPEVGTRHDATPITVSVLYATNRKRVEGVPPKDTYTGERGKPHFGRCQVEFTPIPIIGEMALKVPFYVPSETNELRLAEQDDPAAFWDRLVSSVARTFSGTAVVFVHGYNYGFERTCRMAAELQRSLQEDATVLMLSWPSNGRGTDYIPDQADVEWSVPFIASVLEELADRIGPKNVQVLAHSLGSRGAIFALERLGAERAARPVIGRLVLVAPDFDAQTFVERLPKLLPLIGHASLYASDSDGALKASRQLHGSPRLGEAGEYLTVAEGLETVDVSPPGRYEILGHEYFHFHPQVAADLAALLGRGIAADDRPALRPVERGGIRYWEIAATP